MNHVQRTAVILTVLLLAACGGSDAADVPDLGTESATFQADVAGENLTEYAGTLGGSAELEGGCLWLDTPDGRFELRFGDDVSVDTDVTEVTAPDGTTLGAGDELTVTGTVAEDMITVCQVGPVLTVDAIN